MLNKFRSSEASLGYEWFGECAGMGEKEELTICVVERMEISLKLI